MGRVLVDAFCQAEVHELGAVSIVQHHIVRFDIPVDNAFVMRVGKCLGQSTHPFNCLSEIRWIRLQSFGERFAVHELRGNKVILVELPALVDGHNVWVPEPCSRLGLGEETTDFMFVVGAKGRHLQRDKPIELWIVGTIDFPKTALAQNTLELKPADLADGWFVVVR